jgi:tripartite-type tricarboxylate transporter receptor subunit TctC
MSTRLIAAIAAVAISMPAIGQGYPSHAVTIVVPFAAGGPTEAVARILGGAMSKSLGQPIVVETVGGAGGTLGVQRVARAKPDGYTLLLTNVGIATSVSLYRHLGYDPTKDLDPIGLVVDMPMVMVARPDFAPRDMKELGAYVKTNRDRVTFANAGVGSASHLCGLLYLAAIDTDVTTVAYKGTGPAMSDLIDSQVDFMCDQATNAIPQIRAGKVRVYAVTTAARVPSLPGVPTFAESGLKGFDLASWNGLWAPHGTPKGDIDKIALALEAAVKDPDVVSRFADLGAQPVTSDRARPSALRDALAREIAKWGPIVRKLAPLED